MTNKHNVVPHQWETIWEPERVTALKKLFNNLRYTFSEHDYDVGFMLVYRKHSSYIGMGCRPTAKQRNGQPYSFYMAFGFFYDSMMKSAERDGYIDRYVEMCVREYKRFIAGEWPINKMVDQDIMERVAGENAMPLFADVDPLS